MILQEEEAKGRICIPLERYNPRFPHYREEMVKCLGSQCMAHWKWSNEERTEGYCSYDIQIQDKPKVK